MSALFGDSVDNAQFVRHRRNLILVSLALSFALYFDIRLDDINLLGTTVSIGNDRAIAPLLWVVWAYFLLRYWQVFSWSPITTAYYPAVRKEVNKVAVAAALKSKPEAEVWELANATPGAGDENIFGATRISALERWGGPRAPFVKEQFKFACFADGTRGERIVDVTVEAPAIRWAKVRTIWRLAQNTPIFTDQLLPFVLASLPLVTLAFNYLKK